MSVEQTHEQNLARLARVLVENVGVTEGDHVLLHYYTDATDLARMTEEAAFLAGADNVKTISFDQATVRKKLEAEKHLDQFTFCPKETAAWQEVMDKNGCVIQIRTDFDPTAYDGLHDEFGRWYKENWQARSDFFKRGVSGNEFAWTLLYVPNQHSAERIYPEHEPADALQAYWDDVFLMTLTHEDGAREKHRSNDATLKKRCALLDALNISSLHFAGAGTNLTVGLSPKARWQGGSKETSHQDSRNFNPNVPTYEVYTSPDWRTVSGTVALTKAVIIDGSRIVGGELTFTNGEVTSVAATEGTAVLEQLIERDSGANKVGEIALVGLDSPVAIAGRVFESLLFDENAACHLALGNAYLSPIEGSKQMTAAERADHGINVSDIHHDMMISNEHTTVTATTTDGSTITLIEAGHWTPAFR